MNGKVIYLSGILLLVFLAFFSPTNPTALGAENALVPAGQFKMGISMEMISHLAELGKKVPHMDLELAYDWFADETPEHTVTINSFYMNKYEVTNRQYREFINSTDYEAEGNWRKWSDQSRELHPVVGVTWNDARSYCSWKGMKLPTEAQWEYATKGGTTHKLFPWGNNLNPKLAHYRDQGESFFEGLIRLMGLREINTKPVGSYPPNGYGLYDMIGNVSEWCENRHLRYPGGPIDPNLYEEGRVVRGGSWDSPNPVFIRITQRDGFPPDSHSYSRGFRCVKPVEEEPHEDK